MKILIPILSVIMLVSSCGKKDVLPPPDTTLSVTSIAPATGVYGTLVTITGKNFSTTTVNNTVKVNGVAAAVTTATATELKIVIPPKAGTGAVTVEVGMQTITGPVWTHIFQPTVSTFAGSGTAGYADGTGTSAQFNFGSYSGLCSDVAGNIYVAERANYRIRKITPAGVVTTVAGSGTSGFVDGPAATAQFNSLRGITVDGLGNLFVADQGNHCIRKISTSGIVSTFCGTGVNGFADGAATVAQFSFPISIIYDNAGNSFYVSDQNYRIRKITSTGIVTSIAGNGTSGFADGTGTAAQFSLLDGLGIASNGDIIAADINNNRIRRVTQSGTATTYAGTGVNSEVNGPVASAAFSFPIGITIDTDGNVYSCQQFRNNIRMISSSGIVSVFAGTSSTGNTNGTGNAATFNNPRAIIRTSNGIIYIMDSSNEIIRKIVME